VLAGVRVMCGALGVAVVAGACVGLSACGSSGEPPAQTAGAGTPPQPGGTPASDGTRTHRPVTEYTGELRDSNELQAALLGYANTYIAVTSEAADKLLAAATTHERRVQAIRMKLDGAQDVVAIVTGPNPTVALIDLAVMVRVQHQTWDEYWAKEVFTGPEAESYTSAMVRLDREILRIAAQSIPQQSVSDMLDLAGKIHKWYAKQVYVTSIRASSVTKDIKDQPDLKASPSLLSLFGVDPLAGLSPAVVEVTKSRLLAERALYFGQKMPQLVQWRYELTLAETLALPEAEKALANMDATVESVNRVAELAKDLPDVIADNRAKIVSQTEHAVQDQVAQVDAILKEERVAWLEGVASERKALLEAFDDRHEEAKQVLAELRTTIDAADRLSGSVKDVLVEVKALSGDGKEASPAGAPARPFDIREYQQAIESATGTLRELNAAVASAKGLVDSPAWQERERTIRSLTDDVGRVGTRLIVYASVGLGLALFLGLSGAFVVRRWLGRRVVRA
jgi:hypothetical protein